MAPAYSMPLDRCQPHKCIVNMSLLAFCTRVLYMSSLLLMLNNAGLAIVWDMLFHPDIYAERRGKSSRRIVYDDNNNIHYLSCWQRWKRHHPR